LRGATTSRARAARRRRQEGRRPAHAVDRDSEEPADPLPLAVDRGGEVLGHSRHLLERGRSCRPPSGLLRRPATGPGRAGRRPGASQLGEAKHPGEDLGPGGYELEVCSTGARTGSVEAIRAKRRRGSSDGTKSKGAHSGWRWRSGASGSACPRSRSLPPATPRSWRLGGRYARPEHRGDRRDRWGGAPMVGRPASMAGRSSRWAGRVPDGGAFVASASPARCGSDT